MRLRYTLSLLTVVVLQGCFSQKSYVDPQYRHAGYNDLARVNPPYVLAVKVDFQINGKDTPRMDRSLEDRVGRAVRASGVAVPYDGHLPSDGQISITANDIANRAASYAKAFGTGMTYGLVGSHLTDSYEVTMRLTQSDGVQERRYQHEIVTTVGNASGPPGVQAMATSMAVDQVVEDLVLNFLKDMQAAGKLLPH